MNITLDITWWMFPTLVTFVAFVWVVLWPINGFGSFSDVGRLFRAIPALFVCCIVWATTAIFK